METTLNKKINKEKILNYCYKYKDKNIIKSSFYVEQIKTLINTNTRYNIVTWTP